MKKMKILAAGAIALAMASLVYATAPKFGEGRWFQHASVFPPVQTLGAAGTIAADACGGVKRIYAASAVTTDTTNTFAAPSANTNLGCQMSVVNTGDSAITLDNNTLFKSAGAADVALGINDSIIVTAIQDTGKLNTRWVQVGATGNN